MVEFIKELEELKDKTTKALVLCDKIALNSVLPADLSENIDFIKSALESAKKCYIEAIQSYKAFSAEMKGE